MFKRHRLKELKKRREIRTDELKQVKSNIKKEKEEIEKVLQMLRTSRLLLNAFNRILNDEKLLNNNIYRLTILVFNNLIKCDKEKILVKNIECIKIICESRNFLAVKNISYEYFKSLFYLNKFPVKLTQCFITSFTDFLEYDTDFFFSFSEKMKINLAPKKRILKKNFHEEIYLLYDGFE